MRLNLTTTDKLFCDYSTKNSALPRLRKEIWLYSDRIMCECFKMVFAFLGIKSKYEQKQLGRLAAGLPAQKSTVETNGRLPLKIRKRKAGLFGAGSGSKSFTRKK